MTMKDPVVSCCGARLCPEGSGKGDDPDISKVCYLRDRKTIGSIKVKIDLC